MGSHLTYTKAVDIEDKPVNVAAITFQTGGSWPRDDNFLGEDYTTFHDASRNGCLHIPITIQTPSNPLRQPSYSVFQQATTMWILFLSNVGRWPELIQGSTSRKSDQFQFNEC